ncbi:hypothetical protein PISMIDRAFT_25231 [Pisolithus microcarpus 441]|uniref:Uncharacterized protein n=1 Tax=Pisolithus microcarpus 441 TaxID=765257 RepID=A0A0C9Z7F8_9AGAM|nr:hypothetical protein BKA83DRAFT_25231 [Pisolithus microcarpus]KIK15818.1 hypothetical protein PISMIDRAFT_25231 [Pisolithus microcarpus 441]
MATSSDCVSGQNNTKEEELIEKWSGTLNDIDTCIWSAPMKEKPNEVLERWLHQWKMLSANMTELFEECRRVGVPVPDLSPGDRSNYNRGKELQLQLEQVVSSRKREGGVDGSKTRQAGMSKDSVFASVEPTFKGKAAPVQEDRVPKTQYHTDTAEVSGGKPHTEVEFHKQTENARERCQQCMREVLPSMLFEEEELQFFQKSCEEANLKKMGMTDGGQHSTKKRSSSPQPLDTTPSDLAPRHVKRLKVKPPPKSKPSEGPSAIQENTPPQTEHGLGNIIRNSPIPATPVLESSDPLPPPLPTPAASSAARVVRAEARIRKANAELLNLQRATTNLFSYLAELEEDLREIRDGGEVLRERLTGHSTNVKLEKTVAEVHSGDEFQKSLRWSHGK